LSFKSVKSILETGLDQKPLPQPAQPLLPLHENIRGGDYYTSQP
jgi:hypothetical protein